MGLVYVCFVLFVGFDQLVHASGHGVAGSLFTIVKHLKLQARVIFL